MQENDNGSIDLVIKLGEAEFARLLDLDAEDDRMMDVARNAIDWDGVSDELTCLMHYLLVRQRDKVRVAMEDADEPGSRSSRESGGNRRYPESSRTYSGPPCDTIGSEGEMAPTKERRRAFHGTS